MWPKHCKLYLWAFGIKMICNKPSWDAFQPVSYSNLNVDGLGREMTTVCWQNIQRVVCFIMFLSDVTAIKIYQLKFFNRENIKHCSSHSCNVHITIKKFDIHVHCTIFWTLWPNGQHLLAHVSFGRWEEWSQLRISIFAAHFWHHFFERVKFRPFGVHIVLIDLQ